MCLRPPHLQGVTWAPPTTTCTMGVEVLRGGIPYTNSKILNPHPWIQPLRPRLQPPMGCFPNILGIRPLTTTWTRVYWLKTLIKIYKPWCHSMSLSLLYRCYLWSSSIMFNNSKHTSILKGDKYYIIFLRERPTGGRLGWYVIVIDNTHSQSPGMFQISSVSQSVCTTMCVLWV